VRRLLILNLLPLVFCTIPLLTAGVIAAALPAKAREFYLDHLSSLDWIILGLGAFLFVVQILLIWRAMQWRGTSFDERPDGWLSNLAQAAEWFPLLGLIGTVGGILQTFSSISGPTPPERIIMLYAPAITATGSGLFMALINILPTWVVLVGRDLIRTLGGDAQAAGADAYPEADPERPRADAVRR
jgi:hypothetical protein